MGHRYRTFTGTRQKFGAPGRNRTCDTRFEYTPENAVFADQSARGGVDCDVLVRFVSDDGHEGVLVIETKFVEPEFSRCGFRRKPLSEDRCPEGTVAGPDGTWCRYQTKKGYLYWRRTREIGTMRPEVLTGACPFGDYKWQLWTNHTLAHALRPSPDALAFYAVCAPPANDRLLATKDDALGKINAFKKLVSDPIA